MKSDNIRVVAMADMHGELPAVPPCDLLLLSGDIAPEFAAPSNPVNGYRQVSWFNGPFAEWLHTVQAEEVVATAGNHDFGLHRLLTMVDKDLRWRLLIDSGAEVFGLKFWGTPWVANCAGWAYNLPESSLAIRYSRIPNDTDVLVLHGPPYGLGDLAFNLSGKGQAFEHAGSQHLLQVIDAAQPRLATYGHIHEARGVWTRGRTTLVNCAVKDENYRGGYAPWVGRLDLCSTKVVASEVEAV